MDMTRPAIDADILADRLETMLRAGRTAAARPLMAALQNLSAMDPRTAVLRARLFAIEGRPADALHVLDAAIVAEPTHPGLRKSRTEIRVDLGDMAGAAADAAEAVILDPADAGAKKILGVILVTLNRPQDAITCLTAAVGDDPTHAPHYRGLAMAQQRAGDLAAAATTLLLGIAACPSDASLREAAMMLALRRADDLLAVDIAVQARRDGCITATGFALYGHALASLGQHAEAADAYADGAKLAPGDPELQHMVAASDIHRSGRRPSPAALATIFDRYASRFEAHVLDLGYRIPGLVRAAVTAFAPGASSLLDLGCGTGLVGVAVGDLVGPMTGVDVAPAMEAAAGAKNIYAELAVSDLLTWLRADARCWPVIVAADVLLYFDALDDVFAAVRARLAPGGVFIFSLEERVLVRSGDAPVGWALGRSGRFAHDAAYVTQALSQAGLALVRMEPQAQRMEGGAAVPGWLVVARAGDAA